MTHREIVRAQLRHCETDKIPYSLHYERPLVEKIDAATGSAEWRSQIKNSIVTVGCFDTWNTMKPIEGGLLLDAYGSIWRSTDDLAHLERPILAERELSQYKFPVLEDFCPPENFQWMERILKENEDCYPVGSIGAGIYELTWRLLGIEETFMGMVSEPEYIMEIFDKLANLLHQFIDKICELPIEAVMLGDDWCDQRCVMFGAERWRQMIKPYYRELYDHIHSKGKLTITHSCGSVREIIPDLIDVGLDVLESVQPEAAGMSPYELKKEYGKDLAFWGGLGCQHAVTYLSPQDLRAEIQKLKREMSIGGGYILAPSKTLNASVPVENALALIDEFLKG